jgi:hypothetical protein
VNGSFSGRRGEALRFRQFLFLFFHEDEIMYAKQKLLTVAAVAAAFVFAFTSTMARADWSTTEPAKYVQLPDVETGMDVNATWLVGQTVPPQPIFPFVKLLADDFPCVTKGPITDIHIWGSWLNDQWNPEGVPTPAVNQNASFKLSIHADVPKGADAFYSHPGDELWSWTFKPGEYSMRQWGGPTSERFYDPNTNEVIGQDSRIWQYNFKIDPATAFLQQGRNATGAPTIYWLDVQAIVPVVAGAPDTIFGWKTTRPNPNDPLLNDDAVFTDTTEPGGSVLISPPGHTGPIPWVDMHYPVGGTYEGQSIDMAFVITTVPEPGAFVMLAIGGVLGLLAWVRSRKA